MPTPRPLTLVTSLAVEKPGSKTSCSSSRSASSAARSAVSSPRSMALARIRSTFMPAPSSATSIMTWLPSCTARRRSVPSGSLPAASRTSGGSMPWSSELRTACVSGSLMASSKLLSSSVSWPSICSRTRRPSVCERSRTMRGIFEKTFDTGCMRAFITLSRRSAVTMSRRRESMVMFGSPEVACSTWLRVSTSSPTRFIIRFSSTTSTRNVLSAVDVAGTRGLAASVSSALASTAGLAATAAGAAAGSGASASSTATGASCSCFCALACVLAALPATLACCSLSSWTISFLSSPSPSLPTASIVFKIERSPSSSCSSAVMTGAVASILPSRNSPSRFSPEWASFSSRLKPRNPVVPLMVCTERNISASSAVSPGLSSRSVRHRSMRSSPSWLSIKNSRVNSSILVHRLPATAQRGIGNTIGLYRMEIAGLEPRPEEELEGHAPKGCGRQAKSISLKPREAYGKGQVDRWTSWHQP